MKNEIKTHWRMWIFYLSLGIILLVIYKTLDSIGYLGTFFKNFVSIISPFLAGLLLAYLIYIPENRIEKGLRSLKPKFIKKHSRKLGILIAYIVVILAIVLIINFIIPVLFESANEFISNVQGYYNKITEEYNNLEDNSILKTEQIDVAVKELQNFNLKEYVSPDKIWDYIKSAVGVVRGIFDVFVAIIVSIYILAERDEILKFIKKLSKAIFKKEKHQYLSKYFYEANNVFFKYISSQLIDAIVVGILATIVMKIIGVKYAVLLGFIIGLFNMIPYFGAIVAIFIAFVVTLITGGISKSIIMLIFVVVLQQIDANIINPKIVGESLKISPLLVIIAVTIGGAYFGVIGMFLGVPIATVLKILLNDYIDNKNQI